MKDEFNLKVELVKNFIPAKVGIQPFDKLRVTIVMVSLSNHGFRVKHGMTSW